MAHTTTTTAWISDEPGAGLVDVDLRTLSAERLQALRADAAAAGDLDLVASIDNLGPDRAELRDALVDLVERYRVAIIDGDLDADEIEAMDSDEGLVIDLNGQPVVLSLRDEHNDRAVVGWLGNDLDFEMDHLVEAELDLADGWERLRSSTPYGVASELAQLAGDVVTSIEGLLLVDELVDRGLLRRRGTAAEIVEIRRMTEPSFNRIVTVALGTAGNEGRTQAEIKMFVSSLCAIEPHGNVWVDMLDEAAAEVEDNVYNSADEYYDACRRAAVTLLAEWDSE